MTMDRKNSKRFWRGSEILLPILSTAILAALWRDSEDFRTASSAFLGLVGVLAAGFGMLLALIAALSLAMPAANQQKNPLLPDPGESLRSVYGEYQRLFLLYAVLFVATTLLAWGFGVRLSHPFRRFPLLAGAPAAIILVAFFYQNVFRRKSTN
jgi:hypothetical protein